MTHQPQHLPPFFLSTSSPCPYLEGLFERKIFTHLVGDNANELNSFLTQGGFRRSQNIAYRPACETCRSCISVRVLAHEFCMNRSMTRIRNRNSDLIRYVHRAEPSAEQYALFYHYLDNRHRQGGMSDMTVLDYAMMVEETHVNTQIIEYRCYPKADMSCTHKPQGNLVAVALTDIMSDGLSMVYSFYNPEMTERSLGTFMILDHLRRAVNLGLPYVYLGYWVKGAHKMQYKIRFRPQEQLGPKGWERLE